MAPWTYNADRHNAAQRAAITQIQKQVAEMGGDPSKVTRRTLPIPAASKNGSGGVGIADITDDDGTNVYVWEVKGSVNPAGVAAQGALAAAEAAAYVKALQAVFDKAGNRQKAVSGFALDQPVTTGFEGPYGPEVLTVDNGPGPGAIVYSSTPKPQPKPAPEPNPVPAPTAVPAPAPLPPGQSYPAPAPNTPGVPMPTPDPGGGYGGNGGWGVPSVSGLSPQQQAGLAGVAGAALLLLGLLAFA